MERDSDLELIMARKLRQLQRRMATEKGLEAKHARSARDLVASRLVNRGLEVLELAERYYPEETKIIVERLAEALKRQGSKEYISGGELLWLFRRLGLNLKVETTIKIQEDGKLVSLADKLRRDG